MQVGSLTVEILSEGRFEIFKDGHINRSPEESKTSEKITDSAVVGINPILVQSGTDNILLDTGLGWGLDAGSTYADVSNILTNLEIFGLSSQDITHVILSHLHYDHAAGSSFTNADQEVRPTFPNATYFVHQKEWEYALSQQESESNLLGANYLLDDFYRLVAEDRITFLTDSAKEITDGIKIIHTGGHTPGHQVVELESEEQKAYYLGDLLPSSNHLNHYAMNGADVYPLQAKKEKVQLLKKVCDEKAMLLFYHSRHSQAGRLIQDDNKKYVLADIPDN